jgi:serine/threonine protein kinase, bacterial
MEDETTLVVRDRWLCESAISDGPHGTVWRAWDQRLRRAVALRIVHAPLIGDPQVRRRIDKLLAVTADLQHDNMAYLYDVFEEDGLGVVLISEFIDGPTLSELRDRFSPAPAEVVASVGAQLAHGAAAIHAAGVTHRDLRPDNVRINPDGTVKILGFSAARLLSDSTATPAAGVGIGPGYLAPEQVATGRSDVRSDIYTVGLVLWELAAGAHPDEHEAVPAPTSPGTVPVPSLSSVRRDLPTSLAEAIDTATDRDPDRRWPDAQAFSEALDAFVPGRPRLVLSDAIGASSADLPAR